MGMWCKSGYIVTTGNSGKPGIRASLGRDWERHWPVATGQWVVHITQVFSPEQVGGTANRIERG